MKIVEPKVTIVPETYNKHDHIAKCARVCYASNKETDSKKFCDTLWKNNHRSMMRHVGVYYIIPCKLDIDSKYMSYINKYMHNAKWYISTNLQTAIEAMSKYKQYEVTQAQAMQDPVFIKEKMIYYTFCVETGIDITREYNRKSPNAIAEQSTRYVDFIKKIGIKFKKCHWMYNMSLWKRLLVRLMCKTDEWFYKISRSKYGLNLPPQDARWCLFLDTMSKVVYTYTVKDWEYIINMRLWDYTGIAHKDAKVIAQEIYNLLTLRGWNIVNMKATLEDTNCIKTNNN